MRDTISVSVTETRCGFAGTQPADPWFTLTDIDAVLHEDRLQLTAGDRSALLVLQQWRRLPVLYAMQNK